MSAASRSMARRPDDLARNFGSGPSANDNHPGLGASSALPPDARAVIEPVPRATNQGGLGGRGQWRVRFARIEYEGDVAPKVTVTPAWSVAPITWLDPFEPGSLALFDRIAADMDRQSDLMMRQARALPLPAMADDGKIDLTALRSLPPGTVSYSFVSKTNGGSTCSRSIQVTSLGSWQPLKVVSNSSGDCHAARPAAAAPPNRTDGMRRT